MSGSFRPRKNSPLPRELGDSRLRFLIHAVGALRRLLPHVETYDWQIVRRLGKTGATATDQTRRTLSLELNIRLPSRDWCIRGNLRRRQVPKGVGAIARTIDVREQDIATCVLSLTEDVLSSTEESAYIALAAIKSEFDERVVARHLCREFDLKVDVAYWFAHFRQLAEQSYENKSLVFGCLIDSADQTKSDKDSTFPDDYLAKKKYRALSDGYRTAYFVSSKGALLGYGRLRAKSRGSRGHFPAWCDDLARSSTGSRVGMCLTRHGDILIFDQGRLTFSYRYGHWQYWNHSHIIDLMRNTARVQRVPPAKVAGIVRALYRAALDVSFRRSGGLFVLLRNRQCLRDIVRDGDAIGDSKRDTMDSQFDTAISSRKVTKISRSILCDLAALDGAIVLNNGGTILAYGAVLEPKRRGGILKAEGSRTKAAICASNYGLTIKISSDSDITLYANGRRVIQV